ncbi:MAG: HAD-IIB family hydrolase [Thermodesulfovibrionales bacterium]
MKNIVIFTDLDGTLLDTGTYSFEPALSAINLIKEKKIPLVIISSKTAKEIMYYREVLDNDHPFVAENGGGIYFPKAYFREAPFWLNIGEKYGYYMIVQGTPYAKLVDVLKRLRSKGFKIRGFSDMDAEEIQQITGLTEDEARMAKERDFDEPIVVDESVDILALKMAIREMGLRYTSGKYLHLIGDNDKGKAIRIVMDIFTKNLGKVSFVAVGDNINDLPMLLNVEYPIVVKRPDGSYDDYILNAVPNIICSNRTGPAGFNDSIIKIVGELSEKD